jgi:hypothetical protein
MDRKSDESFNERETQQRFEAALRGARAVGHKQMKDISPKHPKAGRRQKKKKTPS